MIDQAAAPPPPNLDRPDIVVVAPANTSKALADCLARKCSVVDDVNATMRHAEALFASGKYPDARLALARSLSRNRGAVGQFPRAIAALYEASATIAEHNGDDEEYQDLSFKSAYVIANAATLAPADRLSGYARAGDVYASLVSIRLRKGDVEGAIRDRASAERNYRDAERLASASGLGDLAQTMELRRLWVSARPGESGKQRARLAAIIAAPATDARVVLHARTILARLERQEGDESATDRLVAALQQQPATGAPTLVWSPPVPIFGEAQDSSSPTDAVSPTKQQEGVRSYRWADIGYRVQANGTVADAEVLRSSADPSWTAPIVSMIARRRYLPAKPPVDESGAYRIERVTLTYEWRTPVGSLIRRRIGTPSYRFVDLTRVPSPPTSSAE